MQSFIFYLVTNPQAGNGKGKKTEQKIVRQLKKQNIPFITYESAYQGNIKKIVAELADKCLVPFPFIQKNNIPLLIILGGDGSLHEAVNSLYQKNPDIPIGYIPCGSGNDFARGAGISRKPEIALKQILDALQPKKIPLIHYTSSDQSGYFFNNMGIGLDASIVEFAAKSKVKERFNQFKIGSLAYVSSLFHALSKQSAFPVTLKSEEKAYHFQRTLLLTVTNHPFFGGGIMIAPHAKIMNPYMEVVLIEKPTFLKLCYLLPLFFSRKHLASPDVFHLKTKRLSIDCPIIETIQTDGEILPKKSYHFELKMKNFSLWCQA